jgi:hypothetical protein
MLTVALQTLLDYWGPRRLSGRTSYWLTDLRHVSVSLNLLLCPGSNLRLNSNCKANKCEGWRLIQGNNLTNQNYVI